MKKISELVVGDEVVIRNYRTRGVKVVTVEKITPTGQITAGGARFNKHGHEIGCGSWRGNLLSTDLEKGRSEAFNRDALVAVLHGITVLEGSLISMRGTRWLTVEKLDELLAAMESSVVEIRKQRDALAEVTP